MNVEDLARISRLALVLQLQEAEVAPIVVAASKAGADLAVGASAHGQRLEIVMPYHPDAAAALVPSGATVLDGADRLRVRVEGASRQVMFVRRGAFEAEAAVAAVAGAAVQESWLELVSQLGSIAGARVTGYGRGTEPGVGLIELTYPARDRDTDAMLIEAIDQLGDGIGISAPQRTLWRKVHPQIGRGCEIVVSTRCLPTGISASLGIAYPITTWDTAIRLGEGLILNNSEAKEVPKRLGAIAGALSADRPAALELVLGPHEPPDVVVWVAIAP